MIPFSILLVSFIYSNFYRYPSRYMSATVEEKIFSYFPFERLKVEELFGDMRLVKVFGKLFTATQMSMLLYGGLAIFFLGMCILICEVTVRERK